MFHQVEQNSMERPAYFLCAYNFKYDGSLDTLKSGLEANTHQTWYKKYNEVGEYILKMSDLGTVRVFETNIVDIRLMRPTMDFASWKEAAVVPIQKALELLGASDFQKDSGCY